MKRLNKYIVLALLSFSFITCTKDFEEINANPNGPEKVSAQLLFPGIQRDMMNQVLGDAWGIGNIVIQHTAKNQFVNEDRYLWGEINGIWNTVYAKQRDIANIIKFADANGDKATKGVALVMKSWMYSLLTDAYGDVPYSEAVKAKEGINAPKYDSQEAIYNGILADLKEANKLLGEASGVVGGDLIYGGDITKWRKLANSLRVRSLMRISKKVQVGTELTAIVNDPTGNPIFTGNNDSGVYNFLANAPDQFPLYTARSGSFNEFRASKTLLDRLVSLKDPRLTIYFRETPATEGKAQLEYIGIPNGLDDVTAQTFAGGQQNHSRIGSLFYENAITSNGLNAAKGVIMTNAELQFLLAEAATKKLIPGNAATYYENGIKSSFAFYGLTPSADYLAQADVKLDGDDAVKLNKIGTQKWMSLYYQGLEAWFDWRRTRIPALTPAVSNQNGNRIPVRFIYPIIEQSLNDANRKAAVDRQGGDDINTLMWHLK
jgi:hypothetical protein